MIIVDSVSRLLPKVLGNEKSLEEESHGSVQIVQDDEGAQNERNDPTSSTSQKRHNVFNEPKAIQRLQRAERYLEYPQYTKPSEFNNWKVPEVLLSGNHRKIKEWRNNFYKK
ncbi:MAG TPA: hypothetical protein ENJ27_00660 [Candidatus Moranbacteria bacterium]|nr:hypothetical protein [Candidatus Moranbacteria bacterium]